MKDGVYPIDSCFFQAGKRSISPEALSEILTRVTSPNGKNLSYCLEGLKDAEHSIAVLVATEDSMEVLLPRSFTLYYMNLGRREFRKYDGLSNPRMRFEFKEISQESLFLASPQLLLEDEEKLQGFAATGRVNGLEIGKLTEQIQTSPVGLFAYRIQDRIGSIIPQKVTAGHLSSDVGKTRKSNEDSGSLITIDYASKDVKEKFTIAAIADGVAGLEIGEMSSRIASTVAPLHVARASLLHALDDLASEISSAFSAANSKIERYRRKEMFVPAPLFH